MGDFGEYRTFSTDEMLTLDVPPLAWVLDGLIITPGLTAITGKPKIGKSILMLQIAKGISAGSPALGRTAMQREVLYLSLEDNEALVKERMQAHGWVSQAINPAHFIYRLQPKKTFEHLEYLLRLHQPGFAIIDSLTAFRPSEIDENDAGAMGEVVYRLSEMAKDFKIAVVIVHHNKKSETGDPIDDLRGSIAIGGAVDSAIGLYRKNDDGTLKVRGRKGAWTDWGITFDANSLQWQMVGAPQDLENRRIDAAILEALESGETNQSAILKDIPGRRETKIRRLDVLERDGLITHCPGPRGSKVYDLFRN